jgi:ribosomal-protein-alanine N-acetyltransferase
MTLAAAAGQLALRRPELAGAPHALRPIYVRRPDAVMARERAGVRAAASAPADLTIARASGADDLKAVESLQQQTFTNPWGVDAIRWELENTDVARLYVAREPGGALVAYCACWVIFDELHINSFAVDPAWRRRGIARQVLARVLGEAASSGVRAATLEVRRSNVAARTFYEGLGFQVEGTRRDYYQEPREDALILWNRALDSLTATPARKSHGSV